MIVCHRRRFILFHNPKTAGMSLRAVLAPYHDDPLPLEGAYRLPVFDHPLDLAHLRLWELEAICPRLLRASAEYNSVVVVRNPWSRFVSAIDQCLKANCPDVQIARMVPDEQVAAIETVIDQVLRPDWVRNDHTLIHFSPQTWYIRLHDSIVPRSIVPMDAEGCFTASVCSLLGLPKVEITRANRARLDLEHVLRAPSIRAFVDQFYAEDIGFFAANPALAHLAQPPAAALQ